MLQEGGVQEAVIAAPPAWAVVMVQVAPVAHAAVAAPAESAAGAEDVQVSGGLGTAQPWTSTAVAVIVSDVLLFVIKLVWPESCGPTASVMHCTGQVSAL